VINWVGVRVVFGVKVSGCVWDFAKLMAEVMVGSSTLKLKFYLIR